MSSVADDGVKITVDNGESGADEGSKCLQDGAELSDQRGLFARARARFVGDTKLSKGARVATWVLLVLCLMLLVAVICLAASWPRKSGDETCDAPECLRLAAEHLQWMDQSADRCAAPRQWSCGGWLADNAQRVPARSSWSLQDSIKYQELRKLREIISTMSNTHGSDSLEWRLKTLYESCMAVDIIEEDGYRPLDRIIRELGGWHVRRDWSSHSWSWRQSLETLQARYGITPLFAVALTWRDNATALTIRPAGLGLPHPTLYSAPSDSQVVKAYKGFLKDAALILDASTHEAARFADDIFAFEKRLSDLILDEDEPAAETWITMKDLSDNAMQLPFQGILRTMFPKISTTNDTMVLVSSPGYIGYLLSVTTSTAPGILNDYFTWTLIRTYLPYMSKNFRIIWREYQSHITGSTEELSRWEFCARLVQEVAPLGTLALLETAKEKVFRRDNHTLEATQHRAVLEIFENIKLKAVDAIVTTGNVDGHTKSLMIEEVNALKLQIGLKPHVKSPGFLQNYYKGFAVQKHDLFQNIRYSLEFELYLIQSAYANKELSIVRDNSKHLILAEASYNRHVKTIVLPSALASLPYFDSEHPRFVQYARVGVTLGTAVASALAIMEPGSTSSFPKYAAPTVHCLINSLNNTPYGSYTEPTRVAVSLYIRVIGATLALEAARAAPAPDNVLPQLEQYNRDSLFAVSYGQSFCSLYTPQQVYLEDINSQIDGETMFKLIWPQIVGVQQSLHCSLNGVCPAPL